MFKTIFKKELTIHDKNWKRFELVITNEWNWKSNRYFSICSQSGQWKFEPRSELQQKLLDIWDKYHLDWMSPWTPEQNEALEKAWLRNGYSYEEACEYLKLKWLYEVNYKWKPYRYGSWWIYVDFPDNFEEDLFKLIDELKEEEDEYNERLITIDDLENKDFIQHAEYNCEWEIFKLMAICLHCWVSWKWLKNVTSLDWINFDVEWSEYSVYTDNEADIAHRDYIMSIVDDMWFKAFNCWDDIDVELNKDWSITVSKIIDIDKSERASSLSWYDWSENIVEVDWIEYYIYRQS